MILCSRKHFKRHRLHWRQFPSISFDLVNTIKIQNFKVIAINKADIYAASVIEVTWNSCSHGNRTLRVQSSNPSLNLCLPILLHLRGSAKAVCVLAEMWSKRTHRNLPELKRNIIEPVHKRSSHDAKENIPSHRPTLRSSVHVCK